jgi:hypothetical protein
MESRFFQWKRRRSLKSNKKNIERRPMTTDCVTAKRSTQAIWISPGYHSTREEGMNILECVAYVCGLEHSCYPVSACPVISDAMRAIANRSTLEQQQTLVPFILPLALSKASIEVQNKRLFYCVDTVVRSMMPAVLIFYGLLSEAVKLQALDEIVDTESATRANMTIRGMALGSYLNRSKLLLGHILSHLERATDLASRVLTPECEALDVMVALRSAMIRLENEYGHKLSTLLFNQKHVMLGNLLEIGPSTFLSHDIISLRRQRLIRLEARMARGCYGALTRH